MRVDRVLVTGGAGFIASHVVDAYLARGCEVTVIDNFATGDRRNIRPKARLIEADLSGSDLGEIFRGGRFDLVSHHAAQVDVRRSVEDPANDAEINIVGSLRLIEGAVAAGVRQIIFASSGGAAYGEPEFVPQTETHPVHPLSPYGCAKLAVDQYLDYYRSSKGLRATSLRYANVYGPRQRTDGEAGVVAIFAGLMLRGEPATINGDGSQTRDFVFVSDVVRANLAITDDDLDGVFNVGTGIETSVQQLHDSMARLILSAQPERRAPAKSGEQMRSVLDGSKLRRAASLPEPVALEHGLAETIEWVRGELAERS